MSTFQKYLIFSRTQLSKLSNFMLLIAHPLVLFLKLSSCCCFEKGQFYICNYAYTPFKQLQTKSNICHKSLVKKHGLFAIISFEIESVCICSLSRCFALLGDMVFVLHQTDSIQNIGVVGWATQFKYY